MMSEDRAPLKLTHSQFLIGAGVTEGALLVAAFFLGWLMDFSPTQDLSWNLSDLGYGLLATLPMLLILLAVLLFPGSGVRQIRKFMRDTLGPLLSRCRPAKHQSRLQRGHSLAECSHKVSHWWTRSKRAPLGRPTRPSRTHALHAHKEKSTRL